VIVEDLLDLEREGVDEWLGKAEAKSSAEVSSDGEEEAESGGEGGYES